MKKLLLFMLFIATLTVAQTPTHENDLGWGASPSAGIQGYKVYRSVSGANNFSVVATLGTVLNYADTNVAAGNKFDYRITAFCPAAGCSAGVAGESVPSNTITLTTPSDLPNAPTSLTGTAK